jgi:hypothetical protein
MLPVAAAGALGACSSESPDSDSAAASWCLVGATDRAELFAASDEEVNSIVALRWTHPASGRVEKVCSDVCGWSPEQRYSCVGGQETACGSVDQIGICEGDRALLCDRGRLLEDDCGERQAACVRSAQTGVVLCQDRL